MSDRDASFQNKISQTRHRKFKVWHRSPAGVRIEMVSRGMVSLGTASDYVIDRGGSREWKCDDGIRAAIWNETAYLNRMSNILTPVTAPMQPHSEDDCVMLLLETIVPPGWADQIVPLLLESSQLDGMRKLRIAGLLSYEARSREL